MALAYLNDGSKTLAAAAWSDATGFADNATLIVDRGTQLIDTALNSGSGLSTGISYIHFRKWFTGTVGSSGTTLETKFANYTTLPNVIFSAGVLYLTCTNTCNKMRVFGGTVYLISGTVTDLEIIGGTVKVSASATVTNTVMAGGVYEDIAEGSNTMTALTIYGGSAMVRRPATTISVSDAVGAGIGAPASNLIYNYSTGPTTVNQRGGSIVHMNGNIGTYNGYGGSFDATRAIRDLTIGSTATNLYPSLRFRTTASGATVTVSNTVYQLGGPSANDSL